MPTPTRVRNYLASQKATPNHKDHRETELRRRIIAKLTTYGIRANQIKNKSLKNLRSLLKVAGVERADFNSEAVKFDLRKRRIQARIAKLSKTPQDKQRIRTQTDQRKYIVNYLVTMHGADRAVIENKTLRHLRQLLKTARVKKEWFQPKKKGVERKKSVEKKPKKKASVPPGEPEPNRRVQYHKRWYHAVLAPFHGIHKWIWEREPKVAAKSPAKSPPKVAKAASPKKSPARPEVRRSNRNRTAAKSPPKAVPKAKVKTPSKAASPAKPSKVKTPSKAASPAKEVRRSNRGTKAAAAPPKAVSAEKSPRKAKKATPVAQVAVRRSTRLAHKK